VCPCVCVRRCLSLLEWVSFPLPTSHHGSSRLSAGRARDHPVTASITQSRVAVYSAHPGKVYKYLVHFSKTSPVFYRYLVPVSGF